MNKYAKYTMVFTGGLVGGCALCGTIVANTVLKSDDLREIAKRKIIGTIDKWLFGESNVKYRTCSDYTSYWEYKESNCIFEKRDDAEYVLDTMKDWIDIYGFVTVADMCVMAELTVPYIASKYGWKDLNDATVIRIRNGYSLSLPVPVKIK